jgi:hypothetical protein
VHMSHSALGMRALSSCWHMPCRDQSYCVAHRPQNSAHARPCLFYLIGLSPCHKQHLSQHRSLSNLECVADGKQPALLQFFPELFTEANKELVHTPAPPHHRSKTTVKTLEKLQTLYHEKERADKVQDYDPLEQEISLLVVRSAEEPVSFAGWECKHKEGLQVRQRTIIRPLPS